MQDPESVVENAKPRLQAGLGEAAVQAAETHEVTARDGFSIPIDEHGRADIWGGEVVAKLTLGGSKTDEGDFPAQAIDVLHINWPSDPSYQHAVRQAMRENRRHSDMVMLALSADGRPIGAAFLQPRSTYALGREGNVGWFKLDSETKTPEGWTPFEDNRSISRKQATLFYGTGELGVYGQSENSRTRLVANNAKKLQVVQQPE